MASLVQAHSWDWELPRTMRKWTISGFAFMGISILGFGVWANFAQISGAVVTTGVFVTTGENKTIQHLEGGVIRDILVKEGDIVEPGQVLMRLEDTVTRAELRRLTLRHARLAAMQARLAAEMQDQDDFQFPDFLSAEESDQDIAAIMQDQRAAFTARRANLKSELAVLNDSIEAFNQKIAGTQAQVKAMQSEILLFKQDREVKQGLLDKGLTRASEVLALQRAIAGAEGEVGRLTGDIGSAREEIVRIREQMVATRNGAIKSAAEELHQVRADFDDTRERMRAAADALQRMTITAPGKGIVVKLRYHTPGGVIEAGKGIMEIVPLGTELVIEAHVRPQDIEYVKVGQPANIRLTALNQRVTPMVTGKVVYISADALPDEKRGMVIGDDYVARVQIDPAAFANVPDFKPVPGMPAEVYIKTTDRTFFQYIFRPVKDSMSRAFREP